MYTDAVDVFCEFDEMFEALHAEFRKGFSLNFPRSVAMDRDGCSTSITMSWSGPADGRACDKGCTEGACDGSAGNPASSACTPWEEPVTEEQNGESCWTVTTNLPGVTEENICIAARRGNVVIEAVCSDRHYRKMIPVPIGVDVSTIRHSMKNGVLEISLDKVPQ